MNKKSLLQTCCNILNDKIAIAQKSMEAAQASANNETKSSAGDKYETGRAMSQQERDLHARQLSELLSIQKTFSAIDPNRMSQKVELGALIQTSNAYFFIAGSLGAVNCEGNQVMVISAVSPIAQAMLDQPKGGCFTWMGKRVDILNIS